MDRSQEKVSSSKAKLQTLDQGNIHQTVHENQAGIIGINRVGQRKNSTESSTDNLRYIEGRNGIEGVNTRKTEPLMQAYLHANTPGASMGLPYMTSPSMDPRALSNFFYGPPMTGFPGYPGVYGQRLANGEDMRENRSSTSTPADRPDSARDPKEPIRTESVIKIATDRPDSQKQEPADKRQSRPSSDEYTRQFTDRNGELESSRNINIYRGSRDKLENPLATTNGDLRNTTSMQMTEMSSSERTIGGFSSYPTQSVYTKSLTPVSHPGDYTPNTDYQKTVTTSSNMYASMPKLTPIAPRGFSCPNFPTNSTAEVTERQSMSGSVWRPPMGYLTRDYPLTSASEALVSHRSSAGENPSRTEETPETRGSYLPHSVHESSSRPQENFATRERHFPYAWERNPPELSPRYPGHSAYQGYGYARTFQPKRPSEKENFKETEDVRSRTINSVKESSISPDRSSASRYAKDAPKAPSAETNKSSKEQTNPNYKSSVVSNQDGSSRNQANLSKNEKPVVPENVRYKVKDDRKCVLKSDKVTVYPRQGMAYVVSVRETPQKVSDYFSNGRLPHSDVATVSSDSNERNQLPSGYEAASKKDEGQRHGSMREGAVKGQEKNAPEGTPGGDYPRRTVDTLNNNRAISVDETKKNNDRNNNSSFGTYQFPGYPSQSERPRASNRITLSQDKVFVPPNATLEMFEKRELEMERAAASCRSGDAARTGQFGSNVRQKQQGRKDNEVDSRNQSPETNPRITSNKLENKGSRSDVSSKGSDDEDLKIIDDKKDSQQRSIRTEEKRLSSSPRLSRITSPATTTSSSSNPPFLTPFGVNFPPRRNTNDNDLAARESAERSLQAAAYMYGAGNMTYQTNSPYMGSNVRPDMQVMLPVDPAMFYSGLYKQHMMDPSQGGGVVMQDPLTGSLVVIPEAMINPNMFSPLAAESQLMLDPARFWGMQASMEDPRWQQFYQQQKQLYEHQLEKYKQEMIAQQQGRWQGYSVYPFYQKQLEAQRKEENERSLRTADQRPKSRESQPNLPRADKNEDSIPKEKKSNSTEERIFHDSRRDESDTRRDSSKITPESQGESRGVTSYPEKQEKVPVKESVKPPSTEYLEAREKAKEILQQEDQDRQFQQYMLKEPVFNPSKFPFTRIPTTLSASSQNLKSPLEVPRDRIQDLRENSRGESTRNSETSRAEMSPQVVIAAATLANMDFGTRFPFNQQQSTMQLENSKVSRGSEQLDGADQRSLTNQNISSEENAVYQPSTRGKSPTDSSPSQPMIYSSQIQQFYPPTTSISSVTPVTPSTIREHREQSTESLSSEKGSFDIPKSSFLRESTRTTSSSTLSQSSAKNDYLSNGEEECSRLLVAKAEKLPQDEELEVIRIDRPYASAGAEPGDISTINKQDTDLLMSLAKVSNEAIESPSSKSEIFWVACSDDELEDFEVRTINSSAKPRELEFEGHNKENYFKFSLQNARSEDEKKCIREKIEKLREVAKNRTREERFTALTRQKELKSPASIVHSVTSSLNEVLDMNVMEKDIRMRLADLQKKYREKHRELARLQPRCKEGNDDTNAGKSTPIKRGPGRPRKRKYFGASSRSDKLTTPTLTSNGSLDLTTKSGASSPSSSCPQSPGFKSVTSEENSIVKEEPVKKKRKKSNTNKVEESVPTLPSPPQIASPTDIELKPTPVKPSRKTPTFTAKSKIPTSTIITTSTTTSNMEKLISAISPSMLDDSSNMETESESSTSDLKTMPTKPKPKKPKKIIKKEKLPSTEDNIENKEKMSPDSVKGICGSPTSINIKKVRNPKKTKKKEKPSLTPKTVSEFVFPNEKVVVGKSVIKQEFPKTVGLEINKRENNGDSSDNDEVFTACRGGGALDMLADFASSACFEKEKECERGSPFEGLGKGSKRGRPKKPYSPTPESETTPTPKKKKKKKKPSASSAKSSKKSSPTSEEKENDFTNREVEQQSPTQIPQEKTELKEQPKPEVLEEQIEKVPELREEPEAEESEAVPETESVASPEPIKEKRRKSRSSSGKELDESKSPFALFDWQPRRSERIFINSSVTPSNADLSPLSSPTVKSSEFGWPKKTKRLSKGKKSSKTDSVSDVEATEDEAPPTSSKTTTKQKKKKSPAKGKKRRSSSVTDPDFVLKTPKRKAAKRDRSYEEADDDDDEDMADEEEDHDDYQDDTDTEQTKKENQDEMLEEDSQSNKPEKELIDTKDFEMKDEKVENTTAVEKSSDGAIKDNNITAGCKESVSETHAIGKEAKQEENTGLENTKKDSRKDMTKEEVSVKKDKEERPVDAKESKKKVERMQDDRETWLKREKESKKGQETTSGAEKNEKLHREEESTTKSSTEDQSSSDELDLISRVKNELPPEPVISFTKEELKENAKMLLPVDRVFYRGRIAFYQDPDLYGIVLPGERGRRPHLRSTEQLLSQAVKDVIPPAIEYLPVGTRVCAHWSPQYRCFYPGSVIDTPPDEKSEVSKLWVEFDDGDSGIFPLSDLRKIKTKYPVQVEDVESDVVVPERRPRSSSRATSPSSTRRSREHDTSLKNKDDDTSGWESSEDAPIKKSKGRGKRRVRLRTRDRTLSEEATDSDAPRGSRDSDFEDNVETSKRGNRSKGDNVKEYETEAKPSQVKGTKRERRRIKIRDDIVLSSQEKPKDNTKNSETSENAKRDLKSEKFGSKDRDRSKSSLNVQKHQDDDSDACDDMESTQEAGTSRSRSRSSRLSELDLRKKSLTLSLNTTSSSRLGNLDRDSPMQDSTSQDEDSGSCSEVFEESPQTENKAFQPRLGKRRRSQLGKLRQGKSQGELWQWSGKNFQNKRKGKGRKVFYKTIVRGDETISVGDCAVFTSNPSKSNNLPYVGMIENMWEGCSGNMVVKVKWFYHPEETKAGRRPSDTKNSLYRSTHVDENDVQTISHKCEVVSPEELKRRSHPHETIGTRSSTNDRTERLFCCVGTYDPSTEKIENV